MKHVGYMHLSQYDYPISDAALAIMVIPSIVGRVIGYAVRRVGILDPHDCGAATNLLGFFLTYVNDCYALAPYFWVNQKIKSIL